MIIREAKLEDAQGLAYCLVTTFMESHKGQIAEGELQARREQWTVDISRQNWERCLREIEATENCEMSLYVAESETGEIVGMCFGRLTEGFVDPKQRAIEVHVLYILSSHQRQGIGHRLLYAILEQLKPRGAEALQLTVLQANTSAQKFYEAIGGTQVGEREEEEYGYSASLWVYSWHPLETFLKPSPYPS